MARLLLLGDDGRAVASVAVARRRTGLQFLAVLREGDFPRLTPVGAIPRAPSRHCHRVARQHGYVPPPADAVKHTRRIAFKLPVLHLSAFAFGIQEEVD